jgi:hypothetical protein
MIVVVSSDMHLLVVKFCYPVVAAIASLVYCCLIRVSISEDKLIADKCNVSDNNDTTQPPKYELAF